MFYFHNLSTWFPGPEGIVLLLGFVVRFFRRVNCFSFWIEQIWIYFCFQVLCLLSSCDVTWDSFKKSNYCQGGKWQNPLSVPSGVLINVITSLHILDTVIFCFEYKPQKYSCWMLSNSDSDVLFWRLEDVLLCCLFPFSPWQLYYKKAEKNRPPNGKSRLHGVPSSSPQPLVPPKLFCFPLWFTQIYLQNPSNIAVH